MATAYTTSKYMHRMEAVADETSLLFRDAKTGETVIHLAGVGQAVAEATALAFNAATALKHEKGVI